MSLECSIPDCEGQFCFSLLSAVAPLPRSDFWPPKSSSNVPGGFLSIFFIRSGTFFRFAAPFSSLRGLRPLPLFPRPVAFVPF